MTKNSHSPWPLRPQDYRCLPPEAMRRAGPRAKPPTLQNSITLHHPRTASKISCNFPPRLPLYGVEVGSLPATAARRNEDGADELSNRLATNMAGPLTGESKPAAPGGQGCGGKQGGRPGLTRWFGWGFSRVAPDQRAARVRATQRRAFGCGFQEDHSSRGESAHSSPSSSDGESRHKALAFLARVMARNRRRCASRIRLRG